MYNLLIVCAVYAATIISAREVELSRSCLLELERESDGDSSLEDAVAEANAFASAGDHRVAATKWFKILQRESLWDTSRSIAQHRLASIIFNFAQSLSENPNCLSDSRSQYLEANDYFSELERAAADLGLHEDAETYKDASAKALMGAAIAERGLCGGSTDGREHIAKGKKKHCLAGLKLLKRVQKLRPNDPRPIVNEGNALMHLSRPVAAVNRYLAAANMDPTYAQHAHPHVLEFVLARLHLEPGRDVQELTEIAWHYALPSLTLTADCFAQDETNQQALMISDCSWQDFKEKNPMHVLAFEQSVLASWKLRELRMLNPEDSSP